MHLNGLAISELIFHRTRMNYFVEDLVKVWLQKKTNLYAVFQEYFRQLEADVEAEVLAEVEAEIGAEANAAKEQGKTNTKH